ncbi:MAG: L,D-transpeptidase family protein [Nitrospirae bacterium]|nr:L,D-transpeptidase family protein [Nitrospirota bacterium]MCL5977324.1 L,D-transpeptidase family protein [Nitrospirota bacterium]
MIKRISIICLIASILYPQLIFATLPKADKVVVIKSKRLMMLLKDGEIIKSYKVSLGKNPVGPKVQEGDQKTPEGSYVLNSRKQNSKYYLAINISYPNESDIQNAQKLGVSPGNSIAIHGLPKDLEDIDKFQRRLDWTDGCIAVTNTEMEEIWQLVPDGTPIEIKP